MRQTLRDYLDLYAYIHHSTDITLMLQDYTLDNRLSREQLNKMIVLNLGEQTPYFTHTDLIKTNIENWFATHEWNIKKLCDTLDLQYNPLYDKDWYENKTRDLDGTHTGTDTMAKTGTQSNNDAIESHDTTEEVIEDKTTETKVSAYNENSYQPQQKVTENTPSDIVTDDFEKTDVNILTNNLLDTETQNLANTEDEETNIHHYGKEDSGTYAEMIEKERRQAQFNIYEWIIEHLSDEILLGVFF